MATLNFDSSPNYTLLPFLFDSRPISANRCSGHNLYCVSLVLLERIAKAGTRAFVAVGVRHRLVVSLGQWIIYHI